MSRRLILTSMTIFLLGVMLVGGSAFAEGEQVCFHSRFLRQPICTPPMPPQH